MKKNAPKVSVLIPSYNRHIKLVETLCGVLNQSYKPLEVIVYDQSPFHPKEVNSFIAKVSQRICHVRKPSKGLVHAYRRCVELSKGEICLFVDDDVLISEKNLVKYHVENYEKPKIGAVCGQILHKDMEKSTEIDQRLLSEGAWRHVRFNYSQRIESFPTLAGANMSFRRELYDAVGGFDSNYVGNGFRFETDFSFAIRKLGYRIAFDPRASLIHRYGSRGGADNKYLHSTELASHQWYKEFFSNTWYFLSKWYPPIKALWHMGLIWREHVCNRNNLRVGLKFQMLRNISMIKGMISAWKKM